MFNKQKRLQGMKPMMNQPAEAERTTTPPKDN
jgi:hypothetical protein